jgi:hypothetical protein
LVDISAYLREIATTYDRHAALDSPAQRMLRHADEYLQEHVPGGLITRGSGGTTTPTFTPWVGFFDPDETTTPQDGVYLVYLFAGDLSTVTLSLQQGITRLTKELGQRVARERLVQDAAVIRNGLSGPELDGTSATMQLGTGGFRQRAYEAGNIAAIEYPTSSLPAEDVLRSELGRFLRLYASAVTVKRHILQAEPGAIASSSVAQVTQASDPLRDFKPKSDSDYIAHIEGRQLQKTRRHETLVREYGEAMRDVGFSPSTPHPLDLVLRREGAEFLIEAKILYNGNATDAVRSALGQLLCYRHFRYRDKTPPHLVGLFSESIGNAYAQLLESCGICAVWKEQAGWGGSTTATSLGLTRPGTGND